MVRTLALPGNRVQSTALAAQLEIKSGSGQLVSLIGYNDGGSDQYIQIHDKATAPGAGAVPIFTFKVAAGATFGMDTPIKFTQGLWVCNSSTAATLTAGSADCWFLAQVI